MPAGNDNQCCPCGEMTGCQCDGEACTLQCTKKEGIAELCGFEEFTGPSTPPKRYKRKSTSGSMTLAKYGDPVCEGEVSVAAALECRSKAVTATLCGHSEFTTPSTPPKKYRTMSASGYALYCQGTTACPGGINGASWGKREYSGYYTYNVSNCSTVNTLQYQIFLAFHPSPTCEAGGTLWQTTPENPTFAPSLAFSLPGGLTTVFNKTVHSVTADGVCGSNGVGAIQSGTVAKILSDEDTEADAVARANVPVDWSSGGACTGHTSFRSVRTSGFSFTARTAQTRIVVGAGLVAGAGYEGRVYLYRRAVGTSGAFLDSGQTLVTFFVAAGVAHTSDWLDVPQEDGWEYRAEFAEVYGAIEELTEDSWDIDSDHGAGLEEDPPVCAPNNHDVSYRLVDGELGVGPFDESPPEAYDGFVDVEEEQSERTTVGKDLCQPFNDDFLQVTGTVTETLNDEDTDADAIARAKAAIESWSACNLGCLVDCSAFISQRTSGFTVGFRDVQTRVTWTAVIGQNYNVKVRFGRRLLGSTGPFFFYSLYEVTLNADQVAEATDWIDVPNEAGWETVAINCSVKLVA